MLRCQEHGVWLDIEMKLTLSMGGPFEGVHWFIGMPKMTPEIVEKVNVCTEIV